MNLDEIRNWILILEAVACISIVVRAFLCLRNHRYYTPAAFFTYAVVSFLMNDLYWIAFNLLNHGVRMPFSVADFSENGTMLLLAAMLIAAFPGRDRRNIPLFAGAMLFSLCNIVLWICWNGEWLKDIIGGFCYAVFCWQAVRSLQESRAFSRGIWIAWGIGTALLMALLGIEQLERELYSRWFEWLYYSLMTAGTLFFAVRWFREIRNSERGDAALSLAVSGIFWAFTCAYMCAEPAWFFAEIAILIMFVLTLITMERKVEEK